jgi:hypothetical protein
MTEENLVLDQLYCTTLLYDILPFPLLLLPYFFNNNPPFVLLVLPFAFSLYLVPYSLSSISTLFRR